MAIGRRLAGEVSRHSRSTVLSGVAGPDGPLAEPPTWHSQPLPMPMPMNATALDEEAALQMCMWYEEAATIGGWHQLHFAPGIDRDAVMAQARHNKRWPTGQPSPLNKRSTVSSSQ